LVKPASALNGQFGSAFAPAGSNDSFAGFSPTADQKAVGLGPLAFLGLIGE